MSDLTAQGTPRQRQRWDDERVEAELRKLIDSVGGERWPTLSEFRAAGKMPLYNAMWQRGGQLEWAPRLGVEQTRTRRSQRWTRERAEREISEVVAQLGRWPLHRELRDLGLGELPDALERCSDGVSAWAARLGVAAPHPRDWSVQVIAAELHEAVGRHGGWPTREQFSALGLGGLIAHLSATGQLDCWRQIVAPAPAAWNEAAIEAALRHRYAHDGRLPTYRQLQARYGSSFVRQLDRTGTLSGWAQRLKLPMPTAKHFRDAEPEDLVDAFAPLLEQLGRWPSMREAGRAGLRGALLQLRRHADLRGQVDEIARRRGLPAYAPATAAQVRWQTPGR